MYAAFLANNDCSQHIVVPERPVCLQQVNISNSDQTKE